MKVEEIRELRTKAYRYRACDEPEDHEWDRLMVDNVFVGEPFVVLILCRKCGRTPLEMLSELQIR